ncbi:MAG: 5'/3'-nucleotidase SurE [Ruminococcaceae bacterium]|nr:5'/3'-nucleotidase SurE [Oscillospiraceae bacterium]
MRILITNDDGIHAAQMIPLVQWAQKLGSVMVVAPKVEQSGKSQGIELHESFEAKKIDLFPGVTAWAVDSTPADCIRFAVLGLKESFDLVISGINRGFNMGTDIMYSGTAGAVFESVSLGLKAVALSTSPEYYDHAVEHLDHVFDYILSNSLLDHCDAYNVNIPPQGERILITRQGGHYYSDDFVPVGNDYFKARGKCVYQDRNDMSLDTDAVMHGNISIMPLTICRTDLRVYEDLTK